MVLGHNFPTDIRVQNEAESLIKASHDVGIVAFSNYSEDRVIEFKKIKVYQTAVSKFILNKMLGLAGMFSWLDKFTAKKVSEILETESYDAIHLHDLYLFGCVPILREKYNLLYVGDMHENYVEVVKDYHWASKFPNNLLVSKEKWIQREKEWLPKMDKVITVSEGIRTRIESKGVPKKNTFVVPNSISTDVFDNFEFDESIIDRLKGTFNIIYVGGFVSNRGLEHVVKAMPELRKKIPDIRLILVGDGDMMEYLQELTKELKLEGVVLFEGRHTHEKIKSYLSASNIGLVPFKRTPQTDNSSSNKVFQYMYYELPIVSTNCTSLQTLIDKEKCGLIYESENIEQFVDKVFYLYQNKKEAKKMGEVGKKAVIQKYNWDITASGMIKMYNESEKA